MDDNPRVILTVKILPPNEIASVSNLEPTESGPTEVRLPFFRTCDPPPSATLRTSGFVKFVLTPAIVLKAPDCLGKPVLSNAQMSVVVLFVRVRNAHLILANLTLRHQ